MDGFSAANGMIGISTQRILREALATAFPEADEFQCREQHDWDFYT